MDQGVGRRRLAPVIQIVDACNLACSYCYQEGRAFPGRRMPEEVLERVLTEVIRVASSPVRILWYGGEPTLVGLEAFDHAVGLAEALAGPGRVQHAIQTNASLVDSTWATLLARHAFAVTLSLDGPATLHDACRVDHEGHGSHAAVLRGLAALQEQGLRPRASCVVGAATVAHPEAILDYLVGVGLEDVDFPPCIRFHHGRYELGVEPVAYGRFMVRVLDHWLAMGRRDVRVRGLAGLVRALAGLPPSFCRLEGRCEQYVTFDPRGDVYPCDEFSGLDGMRLGNIMDTPLDAILDSPAAKGMQAGWRVVPSECNSCEWLGMCRGGCPFERAVAGGPDQRSALCEGLKLLYARMAREVPSREVSSVGR